MFYLLDADLGFCRVFWDYLVVEANHGRDGKHICVQVCVDCTRGNDAQDIVFVVHGIVGCLQKNERDDFSNVGDIVVGRLVIDDAERFQRHFDGNGQFFRCQYSCARGFLF